jgi:hypothetical protein
MLMVSLKKTGPKIQFPETAHQTPVFKLWSGICQNTCGLSEDQYHVFCALTYHDRWNQASSVEKKRDGSTNPPTTMFKSHS